MKGYKGFNHDMTCRGFKFKEGEKYEHDGEVKICESGFHFCENPIDIFAYYSPAETIFREVDGGGDMATHDDDSKVVCSEITIGAQLSLHDLIVAGVKFFFNRKYTSRKTKHSTCDSSASSATGYSSASSATGDSSASSATGDSSASSATGYSSASSATGYRSASSATGYSSASVVTGFYGKAMAGEYGCIALAWWNEKKDRAEMRCAEIGCGDGSDGKLKAKVWYKLNDDGEFIELEGIQ